jgi:DeoR family fructose operon transcriptional repressor
MPPRKKVMNNRLIPAQRQNQILQFLEIHQFLKLSEVSAVLGVSESTIRRDLDKLEKDGLVERTHGGALLSKKMRIEPSFSFSEKTYPDEKSWIGMAASRLVESGETVFLGSGSTTAQVASQLNSREDLEDVTIITNNISAALRIENDQIRVLIVGGYLRNQANAVGGSFAVNNINHVYADKAIVGADGLSFKYGCTSPVEQEAEISKLMLEHTHGQSILVADHSKWGVVCNYPLARLDDFHIFITDHGMDEDALAEINTILQRVVVCRPQRMEDYRPS